MTLKFKFGRQKVTSWNGDIILIIDRYFKLYAIQASLVDKKIRLSNNKYIFEKNNFSKIYN